MSNLIPGEEIDRSTPIPLYYQVSQILRREIESGKYQPGDYIPTEAELKDRFQVSRATIRQAISELVYVGMLERKRSKGTTVSVGHLEARLQELASFTNEMMSSNQNLTTHILDFRYIPPPAFISQELELREDEMVAMMERIRCVDQRPIAHERWYAPLKYFPGISKRMFGESGMSQSTYYILMQNYSLHINRATDRVSAVAVEAREAKMLELESGEPVLLRTRVSFADNVPVIFASGLYRMHLKFTLSSSRVPTSHIANFADEKERQWEIN